jgi:hypothetical protein
VLKKNFAKWRQLCSLDKLPLLRRAGEPEKILYSEPGDADSLYQCQLWIVDGVALRVLVLDGGHRVQRHPYRGDDDESDGYDRDDLGGKGGVGLLDEVPQTPLVLNKLPISKVLLHLLLDVVRLLIR